MGDYGGKMMYCRPVTLSISCVSKQNMFSECLLSDHAPPIYQRHVLKVISLKSIYDWIEIVWRSCLDSVGPSFHRNVCSKVVLFPYMIHHLCSPIDASSANLCAEHHNVDRNSNTQLPADNAVLVNGATPKHAMNNEMKGCLTVV